MLSYDKIYIWHYLTRILGTPKKESKKNENMADFIRYTVKREEGNAVMKHFEKISMAIDYIEANLTEKIDLDMVAEAVHYSKYHLHRMFSKTLGMTLHDYQRRRQLTEAAKLLVFSNKSILDIALLSGYESQRAFHSIFKSMYKLSPNQYRENERFYPLQLKYEFEGSFQMLNKKSDSEWDITFAAEDDIPLLLALKWTKTH